MLFKPSRYNLATRQADQFYLFNTNSLSKLSLDAALYPLLADLLKTIDEQGCAPTADAAAEHAVSTLKYHGFIVDRDIDELEIIRRRYSRACTSGPLKLTIVPTLSCNMNCHYCYEGTEKNLRRWKLNERQWRQLTKFADQRLPHGGELIAHWFGGEPLLNKSAVYNLSERLMKLADGKEADYSAWVTTNGYNLDQATTERLKACRVKKVQVTFDGPREYHDRIRFVGSERVRRGSFDRIVDNVLFAADLFHVVVRLHVSPSNIDSYRRMVEELAERGFAEKVSYVSIHLLENLDPRSRDSAHRSVEGHCFSTKEFAALEEQLLRTAHDHGFKLKSPLAHAVGCMVDDDNSFLIDADGSIKQCDHYVGDPVSGYSHLEAPQIVSHPENLSRWAYDRFSDRECVGCTFFPICLQGCLHRVLAEDAPGKSCPPIRYNWERVLPLFHDMDSHC
jgi:uncharacterized protein